MRRKPAVGLAAMALLAMLGCSARMVMVPPRIDLAPHELIGVIDFSTSSKGKLGPIATRRFTEASRRDQGLVRIVSLGTEKQVLRSLGRERLDAEACRAIGSARNVKTILVGALTVSDVKPTVSLAGLRSGSLSARVDATLSVQLIEAATGATMWNRSARAAQTVGHVSVIGGKDFAFDAADGDAAYGSLVDNLVEQVTADFHATWVRQ